MTSSRATRRSTPPSRPWPTTTSRTLALLQAASREKVAQYHVGRIPLLRAVVKASKIPRTSSAYNKQVVDSLVAALRTGDYPQGQEAAREDRRRRRQAGLVRGLQHDRRRLRHEERGARRQRPGQPEAWMADLEDFLTKFPDADEVPEVLLQLANANEFNAEEETAREQYAKLVEAYAGTEAGKKAAGSLRRLDLVGKSLAIKGTGLQNETVDTAQYRGKTVLVVFWASWATPVKTDLPELSRSTRSITTAGLRSSASTSTTSGRTSTPSSRRTRSPGRRSSRPGGMESRLADRLRHHLAADHVPGRRRGQGGQPQPPDAPSSTASSRSCCRPSRRASRWTARTDRRAGRIRLPHR